MSLISWCYISYFPFFMFLGTQHGLDDDEEIQYIGQSVVLSP